MTLVLGAPTARLDTLAALQVDGCPQTPVMARVIDLAGLDAMVPLTRVRYVDPQTTIPAAQRNGTIAYPFQTLLAAVQALTAIGGGIVMLAPGQYTEPAVAIPAATPLCLVGMSALGASGSNTIATFSNSVSSQSDLTAYNVQFVNACISSQRCVVVRCAITNYGGGTGNGNRIESSVVANVNATSNLEARNSQLNNNVTVTGNCTLWSCTTGTSVTVTGVFSAALCDFTNVVSITGAAALRRCDLGFAFSCTGALNSDYLSIATAFNPPAFGSFSELAASPRATINVAVPLLASGDVDYVDVSVVGTRLEGIVQPGRIVIANPTEDLMPVGPGGGLLNARCSAPDVVRLAFVGTLTGGPSDFELAMI